MEAGPKGRRDRAGSAEDRTVQGWDHCNQVTVNTVAAKRAGTYEVLNDRSKQRESVDGNL